MSALVLRQAAALMRDRAEALTPAAPTPWEAHEGTYGNPVDGPTLMRVSDSQRGVIADFPYEQFGGLASTHIASWHPAVALAVADWLDREADLMVVMDDLALKVSAVEGATFTVERTSFPQALAVARTYLGHTPDAAHRDEARR